jgi:histidinol phosphatase-like enzyme
MSHRTLRPAVFFNRDGTLIEHVSYLSDPALVRLLLETSKTLRRAPPRRVRRGAGDQLA